jgi:hypothetical protein
VNRAAAPPRAKVFAVLTGDLIGSARLSTERLGGTRRLVLRTARDLRAKARHALIGAPEFFRGDAWQLLLGEPRQALRVALLIRAVLSAEIDVETRVSIGVGRVDVIDRARISRSTGEAFTLSGQALDKITGYFDLTGALPERTGVMAVWFPATLHLCSGLVRTWTRRQAEIVAIALSRDNPTHEGIAKSLRPKVSKQTVSESLAGAGWRTLLEAIRAFEATDWASLAGLPTGQSVAATG